MSLLFKGGSTNSASDSTYLGSARLIKTSSYVFISQMHRESCAFHQVRAKSKVDRETEPHASRSLSEAPLTIFEDVLLISGVVTANCSFRLTIELLLELGLRTPGRLSCDIIAL